MPSVSHGATRCAGGGGHQRSQSEFPHSFRLALRCECQDDRRSGASRRPNLDLAAQNACALMDTHQAEPGTRWVCGIVAIGIKALTIVFDLNLNGAIVFGDRYLRP